MKDGGLVLFVWDGKKKKIKNKIKQLEMFCLKR
jgi:hypothetical protein